MSQSALHQGFLITEEVSDAFSLSVAGSLIRPLCQIDGLEVTACAQGAPVA